MILQLPLKSTTIDPKNDVILIIGGLENLLRIAQVSDTDNLLRRFGLNQDISPYRRHDRNITIIAWLETVDLTVSPPTLHSQPLQYVATVHNARRFFHNSTVLLEHKFKPDSLGTTCVARLIYKIGRFFIIHILELPPIGSSAFIEGRLSWSV
ncbi:hypothetical protein M422DRAFT_270086 [Sphaerobolus stellatus SS14]|uniref:Uncharacterized protein n=1 Tax=Sphaerobolus stellatus (strain SS14) TaxID=990650 RepID=A0A0C9TGM5_SPHS4|nr:hypothetical protein M422DRAFT_270086 [Sphaerobolus stellatus SS14]